MARLPKPKAYRELKGKDRELLEAEDAWKQDRVDRGLSPEEKGLFSRSSGAVASPGMDRKSNVLSPQSDAALKRASSSGMAPPPPPADDVDNSNNAGADYMSNPADDAPPPPPDWTE